MSTVTDIILVTALDDGSETEPVNVSAPLFDSRLHQINEHAGGNKAVQCDVFVGAINGLDDEEYVRWFRSFPWEEPECAQLMLKREHEDTFTVYRPEGFDE